VASLPDMPSSSAASRSRQPGPSPSTCGPARGGGAVRLGRERGEKGEEQRARARSRRPGADRGRGEPVCHYVTQPFVELYDGCMLVLKVS
jgi:hypothetical protein